jgi:RNA polymerase sigma-70 factor (ECF subfamily)
MGWSRMDSAARAALEAQIEHHLERRELDKAATVALKGYGPQILAYLLTLMHDETAAHEVFSQFSEDLWHGLPEFRRQCTFYTWAYQIAWHASKRFYRDGFRKHGQPLASEEVSKLVEEVRANTAPYLKTDAKDAIARVREQLDPEEQTLLTLRIDRQMSWKEISEVLSPQDGPVAEPALAKRFERIKQKVRKIAEQEGIIPPSGRS